MSKRKRKKNLKEKTNSSIDFGDWRIQGATTLVKPLPSAYPGGPSYEAGAHILLSTCADGPDGEPIFFTAPNAEALCMSLAIRGMRDIRRLKRLLVIQKVPSPEGLVSSVANANTPLLFDMLEASILTATFCHGTLEAFANYFLASKVKRPI